LYPVGPIPIFHDFPLWSLALNLSTLNPPMAPSACLETWLSRWEPPRRVGSPHLGVSTAADFGLKKAEFVTTSGAFTWYKWYRHIIATTESCVLYMFVARESDSIDNNHGRNGGYELFRLLLPSIPKVDTRAADMQPQGAQCHLQHFIQLQWNWYVFWI
jgi:hypothetical protein